MASEIKAIAHSREPFLDLLLLADPSEGMVLKYLEEGYLFVLFEGDEAYGVIHLAPQEGNVIEIARPTPPRGAPVHGKKRWVGSVCKKTLDRPSIAGLGHVRGGQD